MTEVSRGRGSNQYVDKPAPSAKEDLATVARLRSMASSTTPTRDALTSLAPADLGAGSTAAYSRELAAATRAMLSGAPLSPNQTLALARTTAVAEDAILAAQPNAYGASVVAGNYWSAQTRIPGSAPSRALASSSPPALLLDRAYSRIARDVEGDHLSTNDLESALREVGSGEATWEQGSMDGASPSSASTRHAALSVACSRGSASNEERREMVDLQRRLNEDRVSSMRL